MNGAAVRQRTSIQLKVEIFRDVILPYPALKHADTQKPETDRCDLTEFHLSALQSNQLDPDLCGRIKRQLFSEHREKEVFNSKLLFETTLKVSERHCESVFHEKAHTIMMKRP